MLKLGEKSSLFIFQALFTVGVFDRIWGRSLDFLFSTFFTYRVYTLPCCLVTFTIGLRLGSLLGWQRQIGRHSFSSTRTSYNKNRLCSKTCGAGKILYIVWKCLVNNAFHFSSGWVLNFVFPLTRTTLTVPN